jgi:hypothetical protein
MNLIRTKTATYAVSAFVAAALLAACSSGGTQPASPSSGAGMNSSASHVRGLLGLAMWARNHHHQPDQRKTWISPDVQNAPRLLFAGDAGTGDVYILRMPDMSERGRITGFLTPLGMCGDSNGNIYIADEVAGKVYKYSRAGLELEVYNDGAYGFPVSCAVNPKNGEVAITNGFGPTGGQGNVAVFSSPSGPVTVLTNSSQYYYTFDGYDPSGDLWVDGYTTSLSFILSGCGASSCSTIPTSGGTIYQAGAVQWDRVRDTWVVFDPQCDDQDSACSYPVSGSGALGSPTTYLTYDGQLVCDMEQGLVAADHGNRYVAGSDLSDCDAAKSTFNRWAYTAGGVPTNHTIPALELVAPSGVAISNKNK